MKKILFLKVITSLIVFFIIFGIYGCAYASDTTTSVPTTHTTSTTGTEGESGESLPGESSFTKSLISGMEKATKDTSKSVTASSRIMYLMARVFTLIQFIGTGISLIVVSKLGISYMISSIEEKAEIKKRAVPIVWGSFLIAATVNILKFVQVLVTSSLGD